MNESTENGDTPVNEIDRIDGIQIVVEDCVVCGETHYHGTGNRELEPGDTLERVAHCTGGGGYVLKMTEETEVTTPGNRDEDNE